MSSLAQQLPPPFDDRPPFDDQPGPDHPPAGAAMGEMSWLSHELRTPMTSLKGAIDLLASGRFGPLPAAALPLVGIAHRNSDRMAELVEDLLQLGQPEASDAPMPMQRADLGLLLREAMTANHARASIAEQRITLTDQTEAAWIMANPAFMRRAIHRLLDNANRAAMPHTHIAVSLERHGGWLRLAIRHQGAAMAPMTDAASGDSLGLGVARRIVAAHGGTMRCVRTRPHATSWQVEFPAL